MTETQDQQSVFSATRSNAPEVAAGREVRCCGGEVAEK